MVEVCFHGTQCSLSDDNEKNLPRMVGPRQTPKVLSKEQIVSRAMLGYLKKKQMQVEKLNAAVEEYDLGRRYLANIMGLDDENMSQEDVKVAISYLLPSSLSNKQARPIMEHPHNLFPPQSGISCDYTGRPLHYLYYTLKPQYHELMHNLAIMYESFKKKENFKMLMVAQGSYDRKEVFGTHWISYDEFQHLFPGEKVTEHDYRRFIVLLERVVDHPLGATEKEFLQQFSSSQDSIAEGFKLKQPMLDDDGRLFHLAKGSRKKAEAIVSVKEKGSGEWTINGQTIAYFPNVMHRQAILSPLHVCSALDKYDIVVQVRGGGLSGQAGAIRLAVAKALAQFVTTEQRDMLHFAGLLTKDPRVKERKKPGQERARKKFTWKRR